MWHVVLRGRQCRQRSKSLGLEITRTNRPGNFKRKLQVIRGRVELSEVEFDPSRQCQPKHFCPAMADGIRQLDRCQSILKRFPVLHEVNPAPSNHMTVGDFHTSVAVFAAERHAGAKLLAGRVHLAAQVIGIAESAQRPSLSLGRTDFAGKAKCLLMLGKTAIDVAKLKIHVAAQVMNLKALVRKIMANGRHFRHLQHLQRRFLPVGKTQSGRQADPGLAAVHIVRSGLDRRFEGFDRFRG